MTGPEGDPYRGRILAAWATCGLGAPPEEVEPLPAQASLRRYLRVRRKAETWIAMVLPRGSGPEEVGGGQGAAPFLEMQAYLSEAGLPVPRVWGHDPDQAVIFLEDLGDRTLEHGIPSDGEAGGGPPGTRRSPALEVGYARAVDLLVRMKRATAAPRPREPWRARRFDAALLAAEWEHFLRWLVVEGAGRQDLAESPVLREAGERLVALVGDMPYGFTHRDFQSRNLMVRGGDLVIIDFQDALEGPDVYDLVALLRDSYITLPDDLLDRLLRRYHEGLASPGPGASAPGDFQGLLRRFDLVTLHRKAKDAGRFVFIDRVKGNPDFLRHVPASLDCVRAALDRLPDFSDLRRKLAPVLSFSPGPRAPRR